MQKQFNWNLLFVGAIFVLSVLFILPSLNYFYALSVTPFPTAKDYPNSDDLTSATAQYNAYMTKLRRGIPFLGHPIPLGLDLQGGVDVLLSVSREQVLRDQLNERARKIREKIRNADIEAEVGVNSTNDGIKIVLKDPSQANEVKMFVDEFSSSFEPWDAGALKDTQKGLTLRLRPEQVEHYAVQAIDSAMQVVTRRVDELGVTMPTVVKVGSNYIRVQVPGESDPLRLIQTVIRPANLEFHLVHENNDDLIHNKLKFDEYGNIISGALPSGYIKLNGEAQGPSQGRPQGNTFEIKIKTAQRAQETAKKAGFYIVNEKAPLTGRDLSDARYYYNPSNIEATPHEVDIEFNREGTIAFRQVTTDFLERDMGIVLESEVVSAPKLVARITNGRARITGSFTADEARELSLILRAGALPAQLKPEHQQAVGPTLGADSIYQGLTALTVGSVLVIAYMIVYYFGSGGIAVLALVLNVLIILATMALCRATLTLSGIGGILLTVGMAVDANILIVERHREEVKLLTSFKAAISKGFMKAFATILDANLTTLVSALVLLQFGTSNIQGFALTTTIGIFTTIFTGTYATRVLTEAWVGFRGKLSLGVLNMFKDPKIDFLKLRYSAYAFSLILLLIGVSGIVRNGFHLGVDFAGGVTAEVQFKDAKTSEADIRAVFPEASVQKVIGMYTGAAKGGGRFMITHKLVRSGVIDAKNGNVADTEAFIREKLTGAFRDSVELLGVNGIGNTVGRQFIRKALSCIVIAAIGILIYVWFRFELDFGAAAVAALFHDITITLGFVQLMGIDLSLDIVAALMMIFGYSINDTIVIFDRIRENMRGRAGGRLEELLNGSINQCLNRTVNTSLATLISVIAMLILGGQGLRDFAVTLTFGMVIGCYSTEFVATPILYEWRRRHKRGVAVETPVSGGGEDREGGRGEEERGADRTTVAPKKTRTHPLTQGRRVEPLR